VWSRFKAVNLLKEHILDNHGIKHIVVKGSNVEDTMGKCPDSDMLDSIDKEHKDPKNAYAEQLYPTTGLHWILPKPYTTDITDVNFSIMIKEVKPVGLIVICVASSLSSKQLRCP
jgi:hypothetical protein